ncbi:lantibiotic dehydratase [Nonomuraea sp. NPDC050404]|uniref:lantibiotic dehydratase n=1 Tax=Nonomuraea sp. NPDC050404 TaxID=3155783 RepID=UPI00340AA3FC
MLRFAGLEVEAALALRSSHAVAWAEEVIERDRRLQLGKDALADALGLAVGYVADNAVRRALLELRRDVFNLRLPRVGLAGTAASVLSAETAMELAEWLELRRAQEELLPVGEEILEADLAAGRAHLRTLAARPELRHGILLSSPSLDTYMDSYLSRSGTPGKRARKVERSLLEYVYRAACKTSPFSTLTAVALGRFQASATGLLQLDRPPAGQAGHTRLNLAVLARVAEAVSADTGALADLPVRLTTGWSTERDRVRYVRREQTLGDNDAPVTLDALHESLFYLPDHGMLADVLESLSPDASLRLGELADRLTGAGRPREDVEAYLTRLMRLGLLVAPVLHLDIHEPDPVGGFAARLRTVDRPWANELAGRIEKVADATSCYRSATLAERRALLSSIRSTMADGDHRITAPRTLLYEDVTLGGTQAEADPAAWEAMLAPDLQGLSRILPVFDMVLPQRLMTRGFFLARHGRGGRCDDVVQFVHDFHRDFYDQHLRTSMRWREFDEDNEYLGRPNPLYLAEIDALDDARREVIRQMRARLQELPQGMTELVLDDDFIDAVSDRLPSATEPLDPRCFFMQLGRGPGGGHIAVLNRVYGGLTLQFSRFGHCFDEDLLVGLRDHLAAICPEDALFAELKGGYESTNLNLHGRVTPYELVCPGDVSFRPQAEQVPLEDLFIEDGADGRLRLRSGRLGREVIPVYLGFLMPLALPEIQRLLLNFSYSTLARIDLWSGTDQPLEDDAIGGHPRVRYGSLVIQRRLWKAHPSRLPRPLPGQSRSAHFLAWRRWRREHDLPCRVFVTPDTSSGQEDDQPIAGPAKPQFIDFDSHFSLMLLDDLVKSADRRLVFVEMLPDVGDLWLRPDGREYVSELTVEIDGVRGRTS